MAKRKKEIITQIKLQAAGGQATPAPPIGPALGQQGVNIMGFCKDYNLRTQSMAGTIVPVEITVFEDRSFTFITKTPPTSDLLKKALGLEKASTAPSKIVAGTLPHTKLREIAELKMKDLNAKNVEGAEKIVAGTARSMGINIEE